ncbi:MAG: DNA repair protein RecO [Lachnospiraceae bacterium]|nr:DNA repair protein RecO [Lachnospiraceae bacterium]
MDYQVKVRGMVIGSTNVGEYDKRIVLLTLERGKITVFAKGARRPKSPHVAASAPFTFGTFTVYEGREAYNLVDVDVEEYFMDIRSNLSSIYHGLYFCELADYFVKENQREVNILKLLYRSIQILCLDIIDPSLIKSIFEIKILMLNGEAYITYECAKCHRVPDEKSNKTDLDNLNEVELVGISHKAYGALCQECSKEYDDVMELSKAAIYAINYIYGSPVEKVYTFNVTEEVNKELNIFSKKYMARFVDRKFNSLEMLKNA